MNKKTNMPKQVKIPPHGWIGFALIAVFWPLNWFLPGTRTDFCFFPLWLGYILAMDGIVFFRKGSSLLSRNKIYFILLFVISIPAWWLFELFNDHLQNWHYLGDSHLSDLEYTLLSSLDFATVIPAVFESAELAGTFRWIKKLRTPIKVGTSNPTLLKLFFLGWIMLGLLIIWPNIFFPLVWLSVYFIIEPINVWANNRHLLQYTKAKDWRPLIALFTGALLCGFFWELWNFYAYPKWIYTLPYADVIDIFEMPVLGYLGYIPFSLELYAIFHLLTGLFSKDKAANYVRILEE